MDYRIKLYDCISENREIGYLEFEIQYDFNPEDFTKIIDRTRSRLSYKIIKIEDKLKLLFDKAISVTHDFKEIKFNIEIGCFCKKSENINTEGNKRACSQCCIIF